MSITIPKATVTGSENDSQYGHSRSERREEDFDSFMIPPPVPEQPVRTPVGHEDTDHCVGLSAKPPEVHLSEPAHFEPIRPESTISKTQSDSAATVTPADTAPTEKSRRNYIGNAMAGQVDRPERSLNNAVAASTPNAAGSRTFEPIKPIASNVLFPGYSDTTAEPRPISVSDSLSVGWPVGLAEPVLNAVPPSFVVANGKQIRAIAIELKGIETQTAAEDTSQGLYPAGGFDLTLPRIRVSFADIAYAMRSGPDSKDTTLSPGMSEIQEGPDAPDNASSDGSSAFTDSGSNSLSQPAAMFKTEQANPVVITRSLQQIETEILQLASTANQKNGIHSLKICLNSNELGSVEITLIRHESGSMSARLVTDSESSRQALNENVLQLRKSLESAGMQLRELDVSCRSFSFAGQGGTQGRDGQAGTRQFSPAVTQDTAGISETNGETDIRLLNLRA